MALPSKNIAAAEDIANAVCNVEQKLASAKSLTQEEKDDIKNAILVDLNRMIDGLRHIASSLEGIEVVRNQINELKESRA